MNENECTIGTVVKHCSGLFTGAVTSLVEQPDGFPTHAQVQCPDGVVLTIPLNQLVPADAPQPDAERRQAVIQDMVFARANESVGHE